MVEDLPFLVESTPSGIDDHISIFSINIALYFHDLSSLVHNVITLQSEELEPSGVGGPDLEVARSSSTLDIEGSASVGNRFDSLGNLIEDELLASSAVMSGSDNKVSSSNNFNDSIHPHLGDDIEWSIDEEAEVGIHSLDLISALGVKIKNSPSLVDLVVSGVDSNISSFLIDSANDFKYLVVLDIDEVSSAISEELEPSRVGVPHLHVVCSSCTLDIE